MKKIILIAAMALGFTVTAAAANPVDKATSAIENKVGGKARAIGLRNAEISYQHSYDQNFVQVDFGFLPVLAGNNSQSLNLTATYNWMLAQPQWTDRGEWGVFAGPGAAVGFDMGFNAKTAGVNIAAVGQIGLEYRFWFPLQLSVDFRPQIGFHIGGPNSQVIHYNFLPALSVRYSF